MWDVGLVDGWRTSPTSTELLLERFVQSPLGFGVYHLDIGVELGLKSDYDWLECNWCWDEVRPLTPGPNRNARDLGV